MEAIFSATLGILTASGVYLLLRARTFPVVLGLTLISYAVNLFLFAMGRLQSGVATVIGGSEEYADPLTQALVLTARSLCNESRLDPANPAADVCRQPVAARRWPEPAGQTQFVAAGDLVAAAVEWLSTLAGRSRRAAGVCRR